jgi:hypothetical protein
MLVALILTILYLRATISPSEARYTSSPSSRNACRLPFKRTAVPKYLRLIGGGGGGPVGTGGPAAADPPGRAFGTFLGITIGGGAEMAEKILRPVPVYTRLSVLNIADSSSVGSRLDDVLAIIFAAIPGAVACPVVWPVRALLTRVEPLSVSARLLLDPVTAGSLTGAVVAAGFGEPPKKLL